MAERGLSQAELARRIGVAQATIFKLTVGETYGTKHLHRIARELGTTPAWLTGETDDPDADAPPEPELSRDQRELIDAFEKLPPAEQNALLEVARSMANRGSPPPGPTVHEGRQSFRQAVAA